MKDQMRIAERLLIVGASATYLLAFNQTQPHSDALRIVRQIDAGDLLWNPNHLLFDPIGYGLYRVLGFWFANITPLGCFELISAVTTVISLLLFHLILLRTGVAHAATRLLAVAALFASASFLSVAVSQYYFMVQMPLLLATLYLYVDLLGADRVGTQRPIRLYGMGALLALATAVMFNNLLLVAVSGLGVAFRHRTLRSVDWYSALRLYAAAAAVGFPIFLAGYLLADADTHLLGWLLSYEGKAGSELNQVYGAKWGASDLIRGAAMTGSNLLIDTFVDPAGLGTVLWVIASGKAFEFAPQWNRIVLGLIAIPAILLMNISIAGAVFRRFKSDPAVRFLALWILSFVVFNFLWNVGDEIFWFQILPATWLLFMLIRNAAPGLTAEIVPSVSDGKTGRQLALQLGLLAAMLITINTTNAVAPGADRDFQRKQLQHADLLRSGDLEIFPGWDRQKWLMLPDGAIGIKRLSLMNLAVESQRSDEPMSNLTKIVQSHLDGGHRVIVARVFDLDHDLRPWYALRDLGWPRERIQSLLSGFCKKQLAVVDGVVFRELVVCDLPATN